MWVLPVQSAPAVTARSTRGMIRWLGSIPATQVLRSARSPSSCTVATVMGTTHQNVAQLVSALQRKGMLQVERDPADHRRRKLLVTGDSRSYWQERDSADRAAVAAWFEALSEHELATLYGLVERVLRHTDAAGK